MDEATQAMISDGPHRVLPGSQTHKQQEVAPCEPTGYMLHSGSAHQPLRKPLCLRMQSLGSNKDDLELEGNKHTPNVLLKKVFTLCKIFQKDFHHMWLNFS